MRKHIIFFLLIAFPLFSFSQTKSRIKGIYFQWGYNKEWYSNSNIHFKMADGDRFTLHQAKAHDKPDLDAILDKPFEISIPQYNYRLGFYLDEAHKKSIEINFDHIKYVVTDGQTVRVSGTIDKKLADGDSVLNATNFLHLEHTDGGNLLHINYTEQKTLLFTKASKRPLVNSIWKLGAGINIPRTDFTYKGERFNNNFHVAGYNVSAEGGMRLYPLKKLFIEGTAKTGYVKYVNALANTAQFKGNRVTHGFGYFELIGLIGYDFIF